MCCGCSFKDDYQQALKSVSKKAKDYAVAFQCIVVVYQVTPGKLDYINYEEYRKGGIVAERFVSHLLESANG